MKLLKLNWFTVLILILCFVNTTDSFSQASLFAYEKYENSNGEILNYRQLISDYDPLSTYPLVIFLHGSGERGDDNEAQLKWGVLNFASEQNMKMYRPIVIAPQCPEHMAWGNFTKNTMLLKQSPTEPMKLLMELIQQTILNFPVDTMRIYITGLSMGGFGSFDAISRYPNMFAAAVPVCGGGDVSKAKEISHLPIWIFHGAMDRTVDPELSIRMVDALTKAGAHPGFTLYPEVGHFSWIGAYSDAMMMDWLFKQRK